MGAALPKMRTSREESSQNSPDGGFLYNINSWEESTQSMNSPGSDHVIGEYTQRKKVDKSSHLYMCILKHPDSHIASDALGIAYMIVHM